MARIIKVEVTGLLNYFDHLVEFPAEWNFNSIYGPNGVGKTKLLELIYHLYSRQFDLMYEIPFETLSIDHDTGQNLFISRVSANSYPLSAEDDGPEKSSKMSAALAVSLAKPSGHKVANVVDVTENARIRRYLIDHTPWRPVGSSSRWRDISDGEVADLRDLVGRYFGVAEFRNFYGKPSESELDPEVTDLLSTTKVHLIATQRLLNEELGEIGVRHRERQRKPTIEAYAEGIKKELESALAENSRRTQSLDRSFPRRLLEGDENQSIDAATIRRRYNEQSKKRERLTELGLINSAVDLPLPQSDINDWDLRVLETYLNDTDDKLSTFDEVAARIELFRDIANRRFFDKTVRVNLQEGIVITRDADKRVIPPAGLSSGEQHELVLMYDLLFNVPEGALVLIDEPEISLHVGWQKAFIPDIDRIASLASLRFLIATHSPQIVNKFWDRTSRLGPEIEVDDE